MTDVEAVFRDLVACLDNLGKRYLVGGSLASSAFGQPRQTNDIDIVLEISGSDVERASDVFGRKFLVSANEIHDAIMSQEAYASFQLLHSERFLKVDVFVKQNSPIQESSFARRRSIKFLGGAEAWFSSPEDSVLQKIRWYELGNRVSDRQWNDLVQVIEVQADAFDRDYFREWADRLEIRELAEEALAEAWT